MSITTATGEQKNWISEFERPRNTDAVRTLLGKEVKEKVSTAEARRRSVGHTSASTPLTIGQEHHQPGAGATSVPRRGSTGSVPHGKTAGGGDRRGSSSAQQVSQRRRSLGMLPSEEARPVHIEALLQPDSGRKKPPHIEALIQPGTGLEAGERRRSLQ